MLRHNSSRWRRNSGGYSLIELLVVITLTAMIAVPLVTFSYKGMTSYEVLQAQSNTSTELNTLSERVAKVIRGTTSIIDAQANTLTIYGYFSPADTQIKRIRYFINGSNLSIGVTQPDSASLPYTFNTNPEQITTTRIDLAMGSAPLFTYYDDTATQLGAGFVTSQIKQIGIYVAANPKTKLVGTPISLSTRVTLRNFKTNL